MEALRIYFHHDALQPVTPDEVVEASETLPSRFVLVNKTDPRNVHPTDADLRNAKLKARLVIASHKDQKAGEFETEAPTASVLARNVLCFLVVQCTLPTSPRSSCEATTCPKIKESLSNAPRTIPGSRGSFRWIRFLEVPGPISFG